MRSLPSTQNATIAGSGYDHPSTVLRPTLAAVNAYGCEGCRLGLIVAANSSQNGNKALGQQEIGQNKKKTRGRFGVGAVLRRAFPGVSWGSRSTWTAGCALKLIASSCKRTPMARVRHPGPAGCHPLRGVFDIPTQRRYRQAAIAAGASWVRTGSHQL